jgi:hypothetical protein
MRQMGGKSKWRQFMNCACRHQHRVPQDSHEVEETGLRQDDNR